MPTGIYSTRPTRMSDLVLWESEPTFVRKAVPIEIAANETEVPVGTIVVYDQAVGPEWKPITAGAPAVGMTGSAFTNGSGTTAYGIVMDRVVRENNTVNTPAVVEGIVMVHGPATINADGIKWPAGITAADVQAWKDRLTFVGIKILD